MWRRSLSCANEGRLAKSCFGSHLRQRLRRAGRGTGCDPVLRQPAPRKTGSHPNGTNLRPISDDACAISRGVPCLRPTMGFRTRKRVRSTRNPNQTRHGAARLPEPDTSLVCRLPHSNPSSNCLHAIRRRPYFSAIRIRACSYVLKCGRTGFDLPLCRRRGWRQASARWRSVGLRSQEMTMILRYHPRLQRDGSGILTKNSKILRKCYKTAPGSPL